MDNSANINTNPILDAGREKNGFNTASQHQEHPIDCNYSVNPEEKIPRVGMEFETEDDAYTFYNAYARAVPKDGIYSLMAAKYGSCGRPTSFELNKPTFFPSLHVSDFPCTSGMARLGLGTYFLG